MNPRCLLSVVVFLAVFAEKSAQAQGPVPGEPPALAVEGALSLPDLHWTIPASQWEARAALGPSFAPTLTSAFGGAPLAYLHDSASLGIGLTDRLQLSLATHGAGLSLRTGDREGNLQGSATLAFTGVSTSNVEAPGLASMGFEIQGLASMDGGLQFLPSLWWVGSVAGHFALFHNQRFAPLLRTGLSQRLHPRLRLQLGVEALVNFGVGTGPLDGVQLAFGSVLQQGLRSFPLVEWQVHPSLSLDGYASVRFIPGLGGALQTYLVGVTYTVR